MMNTFLIEQKKISLLKAFAIIFVLLYHLFLPMYWFPHSLLFLIISQAVPIFVFLTGFLFTYRFKKFHAENLENMIRVYCSKSKLKALGSFLLMTLMGLILQLLSRKPSLTDWIKSGFLFGAGSYYFLIYL
ncbi:MAG: acyltransferase family protein [Brevinema sp.]